MRIGVPREIKSGENRIALTPSAVHDLRAAGHDVFVEAGAGAGSSFADSDFRAVGARIVDAAAAWNDCELVVKVKEPQPAEYAFLREDLTLFTYLHLAASPECTHALVKSGVTAIGYETVELPDGSLPLLTPMSEIAGRLASQVGAWALQAASGGRGVLFGGIAGVEPARVVVIGAGNAGTHAIDVAVGMGAEVTAFDKNPARLRHLLERYGNRVRTLMATTTVLEAAVIAADLVIGAVLVPGARAPRLVTNEQVSRMKRGSVLVDIAIDQGGCFEDSRPTTHDKPTYPVYSSVFYAVTNMPAAVPRTSTSALVHATLPYIHRIARSGWEAGIKADGALALGVNVAAGAVTEEPVARAHGLPYTPIADVIS